MAQINNPNDGLDLRRRRMLFRSWHRGTREMDLIMGPFADAHIASFTDAELDSFERLIETPDTALYAWITGASAPPIGDDSEMLRRLRDFQWRKN